MDVSKDNSRASSVENDLTTDSNTRGPWNEDEFEDVEEVSSNYDGWKINFTEFSIKIFFYLLQSFLKIQLFIFIYYFWILFCSLWSLLNVEVEKPVAKISKNSALAESMWLNWPNRRTHLTRILQILFLWQILILAHRHHQVINKKTFDFTIFFFRLNFQFHEIKLFSAPAVTPEVSSSRPLRSSSDMSNQDRMKMSHKRATTFGSR